jgi:hypothetical protein
MTDPTTDFDTPWKDVLEIYFEDFVSFFFPQAYAGIDWSQGFEFLDKELQQVVRDAELGKRLVDKLVKIYRTEGDETWVLIHLEIQSQSETDFAERMFVYHYRIYDRYRRSVASLAVLGDESASWRPNQFERELFGCEVSFRFPVVKLLDLRQEWSALEASRNPFATVVMAHLRALETRQNRTRRKEAKLALTKRLYEQGYQREDIINLFKFIDWIMSLPSELEQEFQQELSQYEEEQRMPYITSVERMGIEKGKLQGKLEGILQKGRETVIDALEIRFENVPSALVGAINQIEDPAILKTLHRQAITLASLSEFQSYFNQLIEREND